jgi:hypothetical protein
VEALRTLDPVAYVRFASVYREFQDATQFREIVDVLRDPTGTVVPGESSVDPSSSDREEREEPAGRST